MTSATWWDLLEVRLAERLAGSNTGDFFSTLVTVVDSGVIGSLKAALESTGVTVSELDELCSQIVENEREAGDHYVGFVSEDTRRIVKRLYLSGLEPAQVSLMLAVDPGKVDACLVEAHLGERQRDILRLHKSGLSPTQIGRELGEHHFSVARSLRRMGETPVSSRKAKAIA